MCALVFLLSWCRSSVPALPLPRVVVDWWFRFYSVGCSHLPWLWFLCSRSYRRCWLLVWHRLQSVMDLLMRLVRSCLRSCIYLLSYLRLLSCAIYLPVVIDDITRSNESTLGQCSLYWLTHMLGERIVRGWVDVMSRLFYVWALANQFVILSIAQFGPTCPSMPL
jgi:hypothetical protein